ncbi:MAG: T9SS type A sorting domain-containing protein, partial [Flavobacterium sp.]|nr:T9SS type A sorting domain-containing protein [Flavobacterium sp.]
DWQNFGIPNRATTNFGSAPWYDRWHWNDATNTSMNPAGKGFSIRAPQSFPFPSTQYRYNTKFTGVPNNGDITIAVQGQSYTMPTPSPPCAAPNYSDTTNNLIGNPYPSAIDGDSFLSNANNFRVINGAIYFWSHNTQVSNANPNTTPQTYAYNSDDNAPYNLLGGVATQKVFLLGPASTSVNTNRPTGKIAACQAFMLHTITRSTSADENINFDNSMRDGAANNLNGAGGSFYRTAAIVPTLAKNRIWLSIEDNAPPSNTTKFREILVGYIPNSASIGLAATNGFDKNYDAIAYTNSPSFNMYSMMAANNSCYPLAIQTRAQGTTFDVNDVIPLGYRCPTGSYIIKAATVDGIFGGTTLVQKFWLRVRTNTSPLTYNYIDLKNSPYTLSVSNGMGNDDVDSFAIVFQKTPNLIFSSITCGNTLPRIDHNITGSGVGGATGYYWSVTNSSTNQTVTFTTIPMSMSLRNLSTYSSLSSNFNSTFISYNTQYSIQVGAIINGQVNLGDPCIVTTPPLKIFYSYNQASPTCGGILPIKNPRIECTNLLLSPLNRWTILKLDGSNSSITFDVNGGWFNFVNGLPFASNFITPNTPYRFTVSNIGPDSLAGVPSLPCEFTTFSTVQRQGSQSTNQVSISNTSITPNPFSESFKVNIDTIKNENLEIKSYDMLGKLIETFNVTSQEVNELELGKNYKIGLYNIIITRDNESENFKIIKK